MEIYNEVKLENVQTRCRVCKSSSNLMQKETHNSKYKKIVMSKESRPIIVNNSDDPLLYYSNLYFKCNKSLNSMLYVKCLMEADGSLIVVNNSMLGDDFVPFYKNICLLSECQGLLLDVPIYERRNFSLPKLSTNYLSYKRYVPIYKAALNDDHYKNKCYNNVYNRISIVNRRRKCQKLNLDEITPVEEDISANEQQFLANECKLDSQPQGEEDVLILNPLLLEVIPRERNKIHHISVNEHKKIVRITILYTFGFFALALVTFFVIYLA